MTSGYTVSLSGPFRTSVILNKEDVAFWTLFLIENESSFAVTVDTPYTLWLSDESCKAMIKETEKQLEVSKAKWETAVLADNEQIKETK